MRLRTAVPLTGIEKMKHTVKWLFFDVGSTLLDESAAYAHRFRIIAQQANVPYVQVCKTAMDFYHQNQKGDKESAKQYGVPLPPWCSSDEIPYPDAQACLAALSQRYKIGIIANQEPGTSARLARHGLLQYIGLVVASAEEGLSKPDPKIFQIALERSGCQPQEAIMIGDRIDNDILPANRLGMHTIWIKQGFGQYWRMTRKEEIPDHTVNNLTELCPLLLPDNPY